MKQKTWKAGNCKDCRKYSYHKAIAADFCIFHNKYIGEMIDDEVTEFFDPGQRLTCPEYFYNPYVR